MLGTEEGEAFVLLQQIEVVSGAVEIHEAAGVGGA